MALGRRAGADRAGESTHPPAGRGDGVGSWNGSDDVRDIPYPGISQLLLPGGISLAARSGWIAAGSCEQSRVRGPVNSSESRLLTWLGSRKALSRRNRRPNMNLARWTGLFGGRRRTIKVG